MLSYDTRRTDELKSKMPSDLPEELIPGNQSKRGQTATKVPEDAGAAAIERRGSGHVYLDNSYSMERSKMHQEEEKIVKQASEAIIKEIPEVLEDTYRVILPGAESTLVLRKPEKLQVDGRSMTRAEYIRYVRDRCEKELSYYPKYEPEVIPENIEHVENLEVAKEEESVQESENELTIEKTEQEELPLVMKEHLANEVVEEEPPTSKDAKKKHFLRVLWIRSIIAICLFMGVVSFDLLNVSFGSKGIRDVKNIVANNATIQKIEEIVSDFAENTVLPVFGVDKDKEETE